VKVAKTVARALVLLVLFGSTLVVVGGGVILIAEKIGCMPSELPAIVVPFAVLALVAIPTGAAAFVTRRCAQRWVRPPQTRRRHRAIRWLVAAGYALTAVAGVPAVHSQHAALAFAEYEGAGDPDHVRQTIPYVRSFVAIPVLSGVVLSYYEYKVGCLCGFGGVDLSVWYVAGVR